MDADWIGQFRELRTLADAPAGVKGWVIFRILVGPASAGKASFTTPQISG